MKKENAVTKILTKSLTGITLGVTLLMLAYVSVYFIGGKEIFISEISQLHNIETLILQLVVAGVVYYFVQMNIQIFSLLQEREIFEKNMKNHPYLTIVLLILIELAVISIIIVALSNKEIYSENISKLNIIIIITIYCLLGIYIMIKDFIESKWIKEINNKLKERNSNK